MFAELKALVGKSPITIMIAGDGDNLRVTVGQKKSVKGGPLNISVTGPAEELDRDLVGTIVAETDNPSTPAPIAEQVRAQATAPVKAAKKEARSKPAPKPAKAKKVAKAKPAAAIKAPRRTKPLKQASAPKHKASAKIRLPGSTKKPASAPKPAPAVSDDGIKHHASKPGKDACIADYLKLCPKKGDTISREDFIKKSSTERRFERLWQQSWKKFIAEAEAARGKKGATADPAGGSVERDPNTRDMFHQSAPADRKWPFPPGSAKPDTKGSAAPRPSQDSADSASGAETTSHGGGKAAAAAETKPKARVIKGPSGALIAGGWEREVKLGEQIEVPGHAPFVVEEFTDTHIIVRAALPADATTGS